MSVPIRRQEHTRTEQAHPIVKPVRQRAKPTHFGLVRYIRLMLLASVVIVIGAGLGAAARMRQDNRDLRLETQPSMHARVALLDSSIVRRLGFVAVTGSVRNQDMKPLSHVEAVVELLDREDHAVGLESALVAYDTMAPNDNVPFHVEMQDSPRAVKYRVRFRQLLGPLLN